MKLDKKQKILLTLVIIAFAYLAWQLYDLFFAGNATPATQITAATPQALTPAPQPSIAPSPVTTVTTLPPRPTIPVTTAPTTAVPLGMQSPTAIQQPSVTSAPPVMRQLTIEAPMTAQQREYLRLVNRYQIIKMQRLVADEEAAMYASRVKVAELNQQIAKISGSAPAPGRLFAQQASSSMSIGYQLMYIDYQNGRWTATLNQAGRFIEVNVGNVLPDGARILRINQNGVIIRKWNKNYLLNFYGTSLVRNLPPIVTTTAKPVTVKATACKVPVSKKIISPARISNVKAITKILPAIKTEPPVIEVTKSTVVTAPITTTVPAAKIIKTPITKPQIIPKKSVIIIESPTPIAPTMPMKTSSATQPHNQTVLANNTATKIAVPEKPPLVPIIMQTTEKPILPPLTVPLKNPGLLSTTAVAMPVKNSALPEKNELATLNKPKKEVPLTLQQKSTVTQLENYLENKKPMPPQAYSSDEKHLLTLPGDYYTLQIIGSYKLSDLINFIHVNNIKDKAYAFHTFYMDKDWYVLIYGAYKTQDEALNAINSLPPAVQRLKPWVRTIASIHEAIKLNPKRD